MLLWTVYGHEQIKLVVGEEIKGGWLVTVCQVAAFEGSGSETQCKHGDRATQFTYVRCGLLFAHSSGRKFVSSGEMPCW